MSVLLFVDDEPHVISGLRRQLHKLLPDCEMVGANSGSEALQLIGRTAFDAIVLDILMPGMDGIELLSLLKAEPRTKFVPVIMLTGCSEKELKRKALELGAHDFVNKPADPCELTSRLKEALRMKSYEDQLRDQNITLERQLLKSQEMEIMGLLASSVAHDLNNILAVISGNTELAATKAKDDTGVSENLNAALESCAHGARLVKQILQLGRGLNAAGELHDLRDLIDEGLALLSVIIPAKVNIAWRRPSVECDVDVDQTQMIQVLMNLISNAVYAMCGSGTLTINVSENSSPDETLLRSENLTPEQYSKLSITDTGCGMDQSTLDHIFDPFFTTKVEGKGTGIGLSVVNRIVKRFKGFVTVESTVGEGTTFHVYLPAVQSSGPVNQRTERGGPVARKKTNSVCR